MAEHFKSSVKEAKYKLHRAIKKYGLNNFIIEPVEVCETKESLNEKEKYYINYLNSNNDEIGYNIAPGGQGGDIKTIEQKTKLSEQMKSNNPIFKIKSNPESFAIWKTNVSIATKNGQKVSELFKQQQIDNQKRMKENNPNKMYDLNVRKKLSETQKKRYFENPNLRQIRQKKPYVWKEYILRAVRRMAKRTKR